MTPGGLDRLALYHGLGVPEVWIWADDELGVYRLGEGGYERTERSTVLPELDLGLLAEHARIRDQGLAVRAFRRALRGGERRME